jgi:NarL family two-component system response regulator LiaR
VDNEIAVDKEITVFVADDHEFTVEGIIKLLSFAQGEIRVVGQASSPENAVHQVLQLKPDVVLLDMLLYYDQEESLTAIRQIREGAPMTSILAMTAYDNLIEEARRAGAHIATHKNSISTLPALKARIKDAYLSVRLPKPKPNLVEKLTRRELEVLQLMCEGLPDKEIAARLHIAVRTVRRHNAEIYGKLEIGSRGEAIAFALRHDIPFPE